MGMGRSNLMERALGSVKQSETWYRSQRSGEKTMFRFNERQTAAKNCSLGQMLCEPKWQGDGVGSVVQSSRNCRLKHTTGYGRPLSQQLLAPRQDSPSPQQAGPAYLTRPGNPVPCFRLCRTTTSSISETRVAQTVSSHSKSVDHERGFLNPSVCLFRV